MPNLGLIALGSITLCAMALGAAAAIGDPGGKSFSFSATVRLQLRHGRP